MLDQLSGEWVSFQQCLIDSDAMLKKSKEKFKTGLIHSSDEFKKTVTTLFDEFQNKGPFGSSISVKEVCYNSIFTPSSCKFLKRIISRFDFTVLLEKVLMASISTCPWYNILQLA